MHDPTKPAFIGLVPVNGTEPTLPLSMWTEGPGPLAGGNSSAPPPPTLQITGLYLLMVSHIRVLLFP